MPIMPCFNENQAHAEGKIIGSTIEAERMPAMIDGAIGAISIPSSAKVQMTENPVTEPFQFIGGQFGFRRTL